MASKSVIFLGFRHTVESPRLRFPEAEMWGQSTGIRTWEYQLQDWSRWFDVHTFGPQVGYPGINLLRPDIVNWYVKQGPERPIYFAEDIQGIRAARKYPIEEMKARFPKSIGRYGCQLDFMFALALSEGFDRIIMYGNGQPYVSDPESVIARKWFQKHGSALWWIGKAEDMGVEVVFDGPCMYRPFDGDYGYDMGPGGMPNGVDVER